jgi:hypothetical protein
MGKYIINSKRGFIPAPEGEDQLIRLYGIYFVGTHLNNFGNRQEMVLGYFEVPRQKMDDGRPFIVHKEYNSSLWRSNLRKDIEGLLGRKLRDSETNEFDAELLLGSLGKADIIHKTSKLGNQRAEIGEVSRVAPGTVAPPQYNPSAIYRLEDGMDEETLAALPALVKKKIRESDEFNGKPQPSRGEIIERNSRQAAANALVEQEEAVDDDEPETEEDPGNKPEEEAFDLNSFSNEDFRDPSVVNMIRKIIEDLPVSNAEKINQLRELNRLVHRAQVNAMDPDDDEISP